MLNSAPQYRQAIGNHPKGPVGSVKQPANANNMRKQASFSAFGFGAGLSPPSVAPLPVRRGSQISVNVKPTTPDSLNDMPEIRKYRKKFNSEILCASLWGKNRYIHTCMHGINVEFGNLILGTFCF